MTNNLLLLLLIIAAVIFLLVFCKKKEGYWRRWWRRRRPWRRYGYGPYPYGWRWGGWPPNLYGGYPYYAYYDGDDHCDERQALTYKMCVKAGGSRAECADEMVEGLRTQCGIDI